MSEIRQSIATGEWVIIATERARRPHEFQQPGRPLTEHRPAWDVACPFCPGNEEGPPIERWRVPVEGSWQLRSVWNKYPALQREGECKRTFDGVHRYIAGVGQHEVIIESRLHNVCLALLSPAEVAQTLLVFQARGADFARDPRIEHIVYFENHGPHAGTSVEHPHAQMVGLPMVPHNVRARAEEAQRYYDSNGKCVFCDMWRRELDEGERVIALNDHFMAFIPYAAFSPFHTWILPRRHRTSFLEAEREEIDALGDLLRSVLRRLYIGLRDPDYNFVVRSVPLRDYGRPYLHWYLSIIPRVTEAAGFELGSGMFINTALPEESAAFLRGIDCAQRLRGFVLIARLGHLR